MNDGKIAEPQIGIELEFELTEPPQKVWRAISMPAFRETWLPKEALADPDPTSVAPEHEICYRMRDSTPPYLESTVTFQIAPNDVGGTRLRVIHELTDARGVQETKAAANNNSPVLMLAA